MLRRLVIAAVLLALGSSVQAGPQAELKDYYESVRSLSGEFVQTTYDDVDQVLERSTGTLAIQRPDRFRWSYEEPFEQLIVADGARLWVYDVDLEQVTVRPLDEVLGAGPALLLSGSYDNLLENFELAEEGEGWLSLTPRDEEWDFQAIRVRVADGVPVVVEVDSGLGQSTRLELLELNRNPQLDPAIFRFTPPDGVDVIAPGGR